VVWVDWLFLLAIIISAVTSCMRGVLREVLAFLAWLAGAYVAFKYSSHAEILLEPYIETPEFRYAIVFMTILTIFLVIGALLGLLISRVAAKIGLSGLDKSLGLIFGVARGLLLVVIFIMVASFTALPKSDWWDTSWFVATLQGPADKILIWIKDSGYLPKETWDMQLAPGGTMMPKPVKPKGEITAPGPLIVPQSQPNTAGVNPQPSP